MLSGSSIATLVVFILSIIAVIYPFSIPIRLPYVPVRRFPINLTTAPIIAIAILWAAQCLGPTNIRDGIVGTDGVKPYNILILFFSLAYMAITLDITGVLQSAAFWVSNKGGSNGYKLFLYFYLMLTALSVFLGNDPVILSGTAFLVYYTKVSELNPISWLMAEFAAANTASMVLFVGNPTNVVICEGFSINNAAFTAYTILPFLACIVACFIALGVQFRDSKYIPRRLDIKEELDVRSVLLDPIGAWVGSVLLGTCLVVIIVVSFFHVDVWKISLPFAVAKFGYDLAWDHYRFTQGVPMLGQQLKRKRSGEIVNSTEVIQMQGVPKPDHDSLAKLSNSVTPADSLVLDRDLTSEPLTGPSSGGGISPPTSHASSPFQSRSNTRVDTTTPGAQTNGLATTTTAASKTFHGRIRSKIIRKRMKLASHFPTLFTALPRLPFALVPFAFSQFILIEALTRQGWIEIFARWLVRASNRQIYPTIWLIGVLGVILCNIAGTNIGATILLTKVVRAANYDHHGNLAAAIALAVASNIGAVSFTFSASLAGLLWRAILNQKGIFIKQRSFAFWNLLPLVAMTTVGLAVVCAEMAVLMK